MYQNENGYTNIAAFELSFGVFRTNKLHVQSNHGDQKRHHGHIANKREDRSQIRDAHGSSEFVEEPELILSGLPYTLSGEEGPQAGRIRGVAASIGKAAGLPVEFTDERLSSQEAKRSLRESGMSERDMRGKIDMIAASVFLQAWLDARHAGER